MSREKTSPIVVKPYRIKLLNVVKQGNLLYKAFNKIKGFCIRMVRSVSGKSGQNPIVFF